MEAAIEKSAMRKIYLRLLPFAVFTYFLAYIDRINVSFAGLTMRGDLGMSATAFGFAAGTFYWGYFIFEVPSNVVLEKVGARLWIARIMITWGTISGLTAIATGPYSFMAVRFFLGLAEAGLFPGFVLYFTYWFPAHHHARIVSGLEERRVRKGNPIPAEGVAGFVRILNKQGEFLALAAVESGWARPRVVLTSTTSVDDSGANLHPAETEL